VTTSAVRCTPNLLISGVSAIVDDNSGCMQSVVVHAVVARQSFFSVST
jgi:hypothetical protein